jgi:hypothetical protein
MNIIYRFFYVNVFKGNTDTHTHIYVCVCVCVIVSIQWVLNECLCSIKEQIILV